MAITNTRMKQYVFLEEMYVDDYFPNFLVDKGKAILIALCEQIEAEKPASDEEMLALTHPATEKFNDLQEEFEENDSEIETAARDCIGMDFEAIVSAYGFGHLDIEDVIEPREW